MKNLELRPYGDVNTDMNVSSLWVKLEGSTVSEEGGQSGVSMALPTDCHSEISDIRLRRVSHSSIAFEQLQVFCTSYSNPTQLSTYGHQV